jgi:hypothetical protein
MPFCRRDGEDAALEIMLKLEQNRRIAPEWREPPGMLGVYVRRVKALQAIRWPRPRHDAG